MERITLSKNCKLILFQLRDRKAKVLYKNGEYDDVKYLVTKGFITAKELIGKSYCDLHLTDIGLSYLYENPKLKNPSIWDDKKYLINTAISIFALIVAIIALFK